MLSLKKIGIGLGVVACVATSGFSEEIIDKNFCKAYNYATYNYLVSERYSNANSDIEIAIQNLATKEAGDQRFTAMYGALSTDFLKENGIGYSVNMNWGNIVVAFSEYMKYAHSVEDKKELRKFTLSLSYFDSWKSKYIDTNKFSFRHCVYTNTEVIYSEHLDGKISDNMGAYTLTNGFAQATGTQKKLLSPFVKYIVNKDYERAKQYIKSVNAKSGINKVYSEFENACDK